MALRTEGFARRLDTQTENHLFRVVQEALNNVRQHSGAEAATVALSFESGRIMVEVSDNGRGFTHFVAESPFATRLILGSLA